LARSPAKGQSRVRTMCHRPSRMLLIADDHALAHHGAWSLFTVVTAHRWAYTGSQTRSAELICATCVSAAVASLPAWPRRRSDRTPGPDGAALPLALSLSLTQKVRTTSIYHTLLHAPSLARSHARPTRHGTHSTPRHLLPRMRSSSPGHERVCTVRVHVPCNPQNDAEIDTVSESTLALPNVDGRRAW
jgi:hypothetical protein